MSLITSVSTIKESGNDGNGNYWSASYSRSHNDDIMDNFRLNFWKVTSDRASCQQGCVTIKLGTIKNMAEVMRDEQIATINSEYEHLIGKALSSLQRVFNASQCLV